MYFIIYKACCLTPFIYQTDAAKSRRTGFSEKSEFCILPHLNTVCHDSPHKVGHNLRRENFYYVRLFTDESQKALQRPKDLCFPSNSTYSGRRTNSQTCKTGTKDEHSQCSHLKLVSKEDKRLSESSPVWEKQ